MFSIVQLFAQSDTTRNYTLDESVVGATRERRALAGGSTGVWTMDVEALETLPKFLGNTDLLAYAKMLPGVQTTNEATSGINVEGCDNSHNLISLDGIPVYSPTHLFGLVSSFNSSHFTGMQLDPQSSVNEASRIGAHLSLTSNTVQPDKVHLNASVGMISSQASIEVPIGKKSFFTASGRASYVSWITNLASRAFQTIDSINYNFFDVDANWQYNPTSNDRLRLLYYNGHDYASFGMDAFLMDGLFSWGNHLGGFEYNHDFDNGSLSNLIYCTNYSGDVDGSQSSSKAGLTSNVMDLGYKLERQSGYGRWQFNYGGGYIWHRVHPQEVIFAGDLAKDHKAVEIQNAHESYLFLKTSTYLGDKVVLSLGARGTMFYHDRFHFACDPQVSLGYNPLNNTHIVFNVGMHHQFLHQASYSGIGLPIDYWVAASDKVPQQRAESVSLKFTQSLADNMYEFSIQGYGRLLHNQVEVDGSPWMLVTGEVDPEDQLVIGNGYAFGVSAMAQKKKGKFTGWISYTWGHSRRKFEEFGDAYYPSCHEREHDMKALACYRINDSWSVSGTFVFASGLPCTEQLSAYIFNETIVCEYGPYNGSRMPPYMRMDLSATYRFPTRKIDHGLDISLCNVLFNKNVLCYTIDIDGMNFKKEEVSFLNFCIPSLSYYIKF